MTEQQQDDLAAIKREHDQHAEGCKPREVPPLVRCLTWRLADRAEQAEQRVQAVKTAWDAI